MKGLARLVADVQHLFFPHHCAGCGSDLLPDDQLLCLRCLAALPATGFFNATGNMIEISFYGRLPLRGAGAAYYFTQKSLLQHLVFQLKYRGKQQVGVQLGRLLGQQLAASGRFNQVDALVPLPLNPKKEHVRGFNQALTICQGMVQVWNKPIISQAVIRRRYTETQTHMGRINRWENMDGVFEVKDPGALAGKHLLLVDDVVTTGASLEACGSQMLQVPGTTLSVATLAATLGR